MKEEGGDGMENRESRAEKGKELHPSDKGKQGTPANHHVWTWYTVK